jgi:hypothetical protein
LLKMTINTNIPNPFECFSCCQEGRILFEYPISYSAYYYFSFMVLWFSWIFWENFTETIC